MVPLSNSDVPGEGAGHYTRGRVCSPGKATAFSLIEILITVALLSVIILGLVAMFNQTRRAFTSSLTQVDVLESGRAAADMIAREVEQLTPSGLTTAVQNFYVDQPAIYRPLIQPLLIPPDQWANDCQEVYFLTTSYTQTPGSYSRSLQWNIIGYRVWTPETSIGSLYRFSYNNISAASLPYILSSNLPPFNTFINADPTSTTATNFSRIIDGVVDFRIRTYDLNGNLITNGLFNRTLLVSYPYPNPLTNDYSYSFSSNTIPAYVEIELGIVEDRTLARYQALAEGSMSNATAYLANHAGQVHIFRQRIPIRNVNPAAYQ